MIITQTPLRISLLGGNTDFPEYFEKHGGKFLAGTIDKYIYCIVKERFDDQIWINYSEKEIVDNVDDIKHDLVREAMKYAKVVKGVEITFLSDIPSEGSGLGSSSALLIGLLNALYHFQNQPRSNHLLALDACEIEIGTLKKPIGIQDQLAIARGGVNLFTLSDTEADIIAIDVFKDAPLMLFYTGITRKSEDILRKMILDFGILDKNKVLVDQAIKNPERLGIYLDQYWQLKKQLNSDTTIPLIDEYYRLALDAGATGGKIVGAGGGGFLLLYVPIEKQQAVRGALLLKELPFKFVQHGSRVIFNI